MEHTHTHNIHKQHITVNNSSFFTLQINDKQATTTTTIHHLHFVPHRIHKEIHFDDGLNHHK